MRNFDELLNLVKSEYHAAFIDFIRLKDPTPEFVRYMESDPECQKAVDIALAAQTAQFQSLMRGLGESGSARPEVLPRDAGPTGARPGPFRRGAQLVWAAGLLALIGFGVTGLWEGITRNREFAGLTLNLSEVKEQLDQARAAAAWQTTRIAQLEQHLQTALTNKGDGRAAELEGLRAKVQQLTTSLEAERASHAAAQKQLGRSVENLAAKEKELQAKASDCETLKDEKRRLEQELSEKNRPSWAVNAYWCQLFRNEPFPQRSRLADVLIPLELREEDVYAAFVAADLRGKTNFATLFKVPSTSRWGPLAKAEQECMRGSADPFLSLLAEKERLIAGKDLPADPQTLVNLLAEREILYQSALHASRSAKAIPPELLKALTDDRPEYRVAAAVLLSKMGPEANGAVKHLEEASKDKNPYVREVVAYALQRINPITLSKFEPPK